MKKFWIGFGIVAALMLIATCAGVVNSVMSGSSSSVAITPSPKAVPKVSASPYVEDGDWLVGKDIKAGTYRSSGATEGFCAWVVRASDDQNSEVVAVGSADKTSQPQRAVVKNGQVFQTSGCKGWVKQ